jgi:hypothetical protein
MNRFVLGPLTTVAALSFGAILLTAGCGDDASDPVSAEPSETGTAVAAPQMPRGGAPSGEPARASLRGRGAQRGNADGICTWDAAGVAGQYRDEIIRTVTDTEMGVEIRIESDNPDAIAHIQATVVARHAGPATRPYSRGQLAVGELCELRAQIEVEVALTYNGVLITKTGQTPEAVQWLQERADAQATSWRAGRPGPRWSQVD